MYLGNLKDILEKEDPKLILPLGFTNVHSWRGIYAECAFEPAEGVAVGEMLEEVNLALSGKVFEGWKGGDFTYNEWTECHLAYQGESGDTPMSVYMIALMLLLGRRPDLLEVVKQWITR